MFFHCGGGGWVVGGIGIILFLDFTVPYNNSIQITFSPILIHTHIMPLTLGLPNHGSCFLLLWLLQSQAGVIVLGSWEEGLRQCEAHLYLLINIILILSWIFRFISWEKWLQIELAQKTGGSTSVVYPVTPLFTRYLLCLLNWIIYCLMKFLGLSGGGMGGVVKVLDLLTSVPGCHSLDLFLVTLSSTPHLHCVAAKLDCLLQVGIFKHLMFISVIVKCYWIVM